MSVDREIFQRSNSVAFDKNYTQTLERVIYHLIQKPGIEEYLAYSLITCLRQSTVIAVIDVINDTLHRASASRFDSKYNSTSAKIATSSTPKVAEKLENSCQEQAEHYQL